MPLVLVQHKYGSGLKELAEILCEALPSIVAAALTIPKEVEPDGVLIPSDIEVWCTEGSPADVNTKDLEIIIWAHDYSVRKANLEDRKEAILKGVRDFLADYNRNISGFVWILLQPTAFGEI